METPREGLPAPWWVPDEAAREKLTSELLTEVSDGHPLFGLDTSVLNRCAACDEVLIRVGEGDFGMVHLTWSGKSERPPWPRFTHTGGYVATEAAQSVHGLMHA
jgi:hypothetical protein